jgi:hypothetical protein
VRLAGATETRSQLDVAIGVGVRQQLLADGKFVGRGELLLQFLQRDRQCCAEITPSINPLFL